MSILQMVVDKIARKMQNRLMLIKNLYRKITQLFGFSEQLLSYNEKSPRPSYCRGGGCEIYTVIQLSPETRGCLPPKRRAFNRPEVMAGWR